MQSSDQHGQHSLEQHHRQRNPSFGAHAHEHHRGERERGEHHAHGQRTSHGGAIGNELRHYSQPHREHRHSRQPQQQLTEDKEKPIAAKYQLPQSETALMQSDQARGEFKRAVSDLVVKALQPYMQHKRIATKVRTQALPFFFHTPSQEDFKYLARKFTAKAVCKHKGNYMLTPEIEQGLLKSISKFMHGRRVYSHEGAERRQQGISAPGHMLASEAHGAPASRSPEQSADGTPSTPPSQQPMTPQAQLQPGPQPEPEPEPEPERQPQAETERQPHPQPEPEPEPEAEPKPQPERQPQPEPEPQTPPQSQPQPQPTSSGEH